MYEASSIPQRNGYRTPFISKPPSPHKEYDFLNLNSKSF